MNETAWSAKFFFALGGLHVTALTPAQASVIVGVKPLQGVEAMPVATSETEQQVGVIYYLSCQGHGVSSQEFRCTRQMIAEQTPEEVAAGLMGSLIETIEMVREAAQDKKRNWEED